MTMIKPAGQQKLFDGKSGSANEIIPEWACVQSPTLSSNIITGVKQQHWISVRLFMRFWAMCRPRCELKLQLVSSFSLLLIEFSRWPVAPDTRMLRLAVTKLCHPKFSEEVAWAFTVLEWPGGTMVKELLTYCFRNFGTCGSEKKILAFFLHSIYFS